MLQEDYLFAHTSGGYENGLGHSDWLKEHVRSRMDYVLHYLWGLREWVRPGMDYIFAYSSGVTRMSGQRMEEDGMRQPVSDKQPPLRRATKSY